MSRDAVRQTANVLFAVAQPLVPALTSRLGLAPIGAVANEYPTYLSPAGYAFAIWGPIFALSLAYAVYQAQPSRRSDPLLRRVGWFTAAAMLGDTVWELLFPARLFVAANLVIFAVLAALVATHVGIARHARTHQLATAERWLARGTFGAFCGWITVASAANTAQTLTAAGWRGGEVSPVAWAVAVLLTVAAIGVWATAKLRGSSWYGLAVSWGLVGIVVARRSAGDPLPSPTVAVAAAAAAAAVAATVLIARVGAARGK